MIGSSIGAFSAKVDLVGDFYITTNPSGVSVTSRPGSASSGAVVAEPVNGVGPYEYQWTITGTAISINNPEIAATGFSASGGNERYQETATVKVIDKGNSDAEASRDVNVIFLFEDIGA